MNKQKKIEILQKIIQIDSVNANETEVANYISSLFSKFPDVEIQKITYAPHRDNLVLTIGKNNGPMLGFTGHMDVVAPGNLDDWNYDPFSATIADNKIYGRGATDMKSGLAALVAALLELLEQGTIIPGKIRLLATVGEETGEYGAAQLTKQGFADNLAGLIVAEPTSSMQKIIYTARGVIDYKVKSYGKTAHSAEPEAGINAIDNLIVFYHLALERLRKFNKTDTVLGGVTHSITKIKGGEQVNSIPSYAELMGNIRTIPDYPNQRFYDELEAIIAELNQREGFNLAITYSFPEEAISGKPDSQIIKIAQETHQQIFGSSAKVTGSSGANDGAEFLQAKGNFDSIEIGPGSNTSHQSNEYVEITDYLNAITFYKQFALNFLQDKEIKNHASQIY
ncbi:acetylornithine deacetylase succinyl-diaminopimelate desuccinylase-like protein [Liquorilactobacillus sucicola DSM 21376 = JCM 15457]|uniref:Probable succinyl-diaminopimelate desuccinylase n=2 Tax=Liquorilactobacillus sucicola TaxID=519050 RepID=A0A0R2E168_9LACO|nr:ArgE/DapE family deacylase [Liquorilactobacillus sucicola]KRN06935.1 acetylornithine deacetylase succinyl-diaminopimelate desuccinylase-like protein [Liquorilactobacillus sucicola DSM 21376 = JCM 15457]